MNNTTILPTRRGAMLHNELKALYASYERELQRWIATYPRGVSCRKGCRTCCNMSVGLYVPEAVVLADWLTDAQYAAVARHAQRVLAYAATTPDYQAGFRYADLGWCPFLDADTGACTIHAHRPANCRHVFSNMPPKYCAKGAELLLEHDAGEQAAFLAQLDPDVNADELPFMAPLHAIFYDQYELYLLMLTARYFNVIVQGEMSWLIVLAREHGLWNIATQPGGTPDDFIRYARSTGLYHEHLLTNCQEIPPHLREAGAEIDFTQIPPGYSLWQHR